MLNSDLTGPSQAEPAPHLAVLMPNDGKQPWQLANTSGSGAHRICPAQNARWTSS